MHIEDGQRLNFSHTLFDPEDSFEGGDFASCLNARGMYESRRFALRLNPKIHALVDAVVEKSAKGEINFSSEEIQAYSTYIHETIHWWQHKGATSGFVRSMLPPLQTHVNLKDLRSIIASVGPKKSIQTLGIQGELGQLPAGSPVGPLANAITNNFMDTEFFLALTLNPAKYDQQIYANKYFESAGHSFLITFDHLLGFLRTIFDEQGLAIPDPEPIERNLQALKARKATGYYRGSPISRAPVGLHQLYEGQARFNQLLFVAFAGNTINFTEARADGLLDGIYGEAFQAFLNITRSSEPTSVTDPLVALFLLVCDLSINPTAGFPLPIDDYDNFFLDADPGIRFAVLCRTIAEELPELRTAIVEYSAEEYWAVVEQLCTVSGLDSYLNALKTIVSWKSTQPKIAQLLDEHREFVFTNDSIVPRVVFSEFLQFSEDKLSRPDFFCWAGYWLTHAAGTDERDLWLYHLSLFSDKQHDGRIFARMARSHDEPVVMEVFNQFFAAIVFYDLTRQWVLQNGPFLPDYPWLVLPSQEAEFHKRISDVFERHCGARLEVFSVLPPPTIPTSRI